MLKALIHKGNMQ